MSFSNNQVDQHVKERDVSLSFKVCQYVIAMAYGYTI